MLVKQELRLFYKLKNSLRAHIPSHNQAKNVLFAGLKSIYFKVEFQTFLKIEKTGS